MPVADTPTTVTTAPDPISDDDDDAGHGIGPLALNTFLDDVAVDKKDDGCADEDMFPPPSVAAPAAIADAAGDGWHLRPGLSTAAAPARSGFISPSQAQRPAGRGNGWRAAAASTAGGGGVSAPVGQPAAPPSTQHGVGGGGGAGRDGGGVPGPGFLASQGSLPGAWKLPRFTLAPSAPASAKAPSQRPGLPLFQAPRSTTPAAAGGQQQRSEYHHEAAPAHTNQWLVAPSKRGAAQPQHAQHRAGAAFQQPPHVAEQARRLHLSSAGIMTGSTSAKAMAARQAAAAAAVVPPAPTAVTPAAARTGGVFVEASSGHRRQQQGAAPPPPPPQTVQLTQPSDESGPAADMDESELHGILAAAAAGVPPARPPVPLGSSGAARHSDSATQGDVPAAAAAAPPPPAAAAAPLHESTEAMAVNDGRVAHAARTVLTFDDVAVNLDVETPMRLHGDPGRENGAPGAARCGGGVKEVTPQPKIHGGDENDAASHSAPPAGMASAPPLVRLHHRRASVLAVHVAGGMPFRPASQANGQDDHLASWTVAVLTASGSRASGPSGDDDAGSTTSPCVLYIWRCVSPRVMDNTASGGVQPCEARLVGVMRGCAAAGPHGAQDIASAKEDWFALSPDGASLYCLPRLLTTSGSSDSAAAPPGAATNPVALYALDCGDDADAAQPAPSAPVPELRVRSALHAAHVDAASSPPPVCVTAFRVSQPRKSQESVLVAAAGPGGTCSVWHSGGPLSRAVGDLCAISLPVAHVGGTPTSAVVSLCPVRVRGGGGSELDDDNVACQLDGSRLLLGITAAGQAVAWCLATRALLWVTALPDRWALRQIAPLQWGAQPATPGDAASTWTPFTAVARVAHLPDGAASGRGTSPDVVAYLSFSCTPSPTSADDGAPTAAQNAVVARVSLPLPLPGKPVAVAARGGFAMALLTSSPTHSSICSGNPTLHRPLGVWHVPSGAHVAGLGMKDASCAAWAAEQPQGGDPACLLVSGHANGRVLVYRLV